MNITTKKRDMLFSNKTFLTLSLISIFLISIFALSIVSAQETKPVWCINNGKIEKSDVALFETLSSNCYATQSEAQAALFNQQSNSNGAASKAVSETAAWCAKNDKTSSWNDPESGEAGFWKQRVCLWFGGYDSVTQTNLPAITEMIKWFLLFLVVILIYSSLSYAGFPEGTFLRILIAVPVGFLATFFISQRELLTMMISYSALGLTFAVFTPILILAFFTLAVAKKANPMGIYLQKIVWLIFSIYLILKSALYLFGPKMISWMKVIGVDMTSSTGANILGFDMSQNTDPITLLILFITAIAIILIMVVGNSYVIDWLNKEARESEVEAQQAMLERAHAKNVLDAKMMQKSTDKV